MGKTAQQKQAEQANLQLQQLQLEQARQNAATQNRLLDFQQQQYNAISPLATQALQIGQGAMNGQLPQGFLNAYLLPQRTELASGFQGARQNLTEALGKYGQLGSGIGVGPMAKQYNAEAVAQGNATANANLQALNSALGLGFRGANLLYGQQGVFNPATYGNLSTGDVSTGTQDPAQYQSN